jgi:outer membrane protein assembly factor BamB
MSGVIDLGVVTPFEPPAAARPVPRRALAAVLALICLVTVTGSAPPRPHSLPTLWAVPVNGNQDSFTVTPGGVYVLSTLGRRRISAYEPRTGKIRWTIPGLDDTAWIGAVSAGVLLTPAFNDGIAQTVALDTATGRQLWRERGDALAIAGGRVLLTEPDPDGPSVRSLRVVDLHSGATTWAYAADDRRTWAAADADTSDRVVIAAEDGQVEVHDLATGRLVAGARMPWPGAANRPDQPNGIGVTGHTLILPGADNSRPTMTVYDTETLRERWHVASPSLSGLYPCGAVMCLNDADGLTGYDEDTGRVLWHRAGAGYASTLHADRLVIENGDEGARRIVADARTGRQLTDLGTGSLAYGYGAGDPVFALSLTRDPPGRTSVGELDERTGAVELRGAVDPPADFCQNAGDVMACLVGGAQLTILDLGAAAS